MEDASSPAWADFLRAALRSGRQDASWTLSEAAVPSSSGDDDPGRRIPTDPAKLEYIRRLIASILDGRALVLKYNVVLLGILALLAVLHWGPKIRDRRRDRGSRLTDANKAADTASRRSSDGQCSTGEGASQRDPSSSSSSTLQGNQSPDGRSAAKALDLDVERQPLLGRDLAPPQLPRGLGKRTWDSINSWLMYQPRPIPLINRTLPSNGTSLFVLAYVGLNAFFHLYLVPWGREYFFAFAERAGAVFVINLPLLYLLAAKNQPLKLLTGYSYEALNIFHRRVGELMCFEAFVHFGSMIIWEVWCAPDWLRFGGLLRFLSTGLVLLGLGAFVSYELLFFTSLGSFRQRWYELFLASHVILQIVALAFLYLHFWVSRPYVLISLAIFLADRLIWRLWLNKATFTADLHILEDGSTLILSTNWDVPRRKPSWFSWRHKSILDGWHPMDHVFISAPSLSKTSTLQTHPFTIASAAPPAASATSEHQRHAWLNLLIRAQSGFTLDLLEHARSHSSIPVRFDGPYGSTDALETLGRCDTVLLIAGGSGIAVVFPLVWALVHDGRRSQALHVLWVVHSRAHRSWLPQERLHELAQAGVHITMPEPTAEAGRPDVGGYVTGLAQCGGRIGVVASGPDGMNRAARNASAEAVGRGADVRLRIEKFGW